MLNLAAIDISEACKAWTRSSASSGKVVATAAPALIMVIAVFMILNQLRIAPEIVSITYSALLGSVALGAALAFGLGGRDVAGRMLEDAYRKGQEQRGQVEHDVQLGKERAEEKAGGLTA